MWWDQHCPAPVACHGSQYYGAEHQQAATFVQWPNRWGVKKIPYIEIIESMPRRSKLREKHLRSAARARSARTSLDTNFSPTLHSPSPTDVFHTIPESDDEICSWTGGVNNHITKEMQDDPLFISDTSSDEDLSELEGDELRNSLKAQALRVKGKPVPYHQIMQPRSSAQWRKVESNRSLGYNGHSSRTKRREAQFARAKAIEDERTQNS